MSNCEICGQETELVQAEIESMIVSVCSNCAKFGQVKGPLQIKTEAVKKIIKRPARPEPHLEATESVIPNYAQKIRRAREKLGLKQKDFAQKINEKESLLHKMETGTFEPSLSLARKLERLLNIILIEKIEEKRVVTSKTPAEGLTIGDMIKTK